MIKTFLLGSFSCHFFRREADFLWLISSPSLVISPEIIKYLLFASSTRLKAFLKSDSLSTMSFLSIFNSFFKFSVSAIKDSSSTCGSEIIDISKYLIFFILFLFVRTTFIILSRIKNTLRIMNPVKLDLIKNIGWQFKWKIMLAKIVKILYNVCKEYAYFLRF